VAAFPLPPKQRFVELVTGIIIAGGGEPLTLKTIAIKYDEKIGCEWPPTAFDVHIIRALSPDGCGGTSIGVDALVKELKLDGRLEIVDDKGRPANTSGLAASKHKGRITHLRFKATGPQPEPATSATR